MPIPFPELNRKPSLKNRRRTLDTTQRDEFQNGAEAAAATQTRFRHEWNVTIEAVTVADQHKLDDFESKVGLGVMPFLFRNDDDPTNPHELVVRFASLPAYQDFDMTDDGKRFTCTFVIREV